MLNFKKKDIGQPKALVTIGITSYNYSKYIVDALNSVIEQTYQEIEIIIIDDCSTDDCPKKITSWITKNNINCTYINHQKNKGITKTLNEIVSLAKGKYIVFFATDDIMMPERISKQVEVLEQSGEEYGLCYLRPFFIDGEGNKIDYKDPFRTDYLYEGNVLLDYVKREFGFVSPTAMLNLNVFKKVGGFNEKVLIEDYDFFLRVISCYKVKPSTYPGYYYRVKNYTSDVFAQSQKNSFERYNTDRIISNAEALKFIADATCRKILIKKINQYLKTLAVNNSKMFWQSTAYLMLRKKIFVPPKIIAIKIANNFKLKQHNNKP